MTHADERLAVGGGDAGRAGSAAARPGSGRGSRSAGRRGRTASRRPAATARPPAPPSWHAAHVAFANAVRPRSASPFAQSIAASRFFHAAASKPSLASSGFSVNGSFLMTHAVHAFSSAPIFCPLYCCNSATSSARHGGVLRFSGEPAQRPHRLARTFRSWFWRKLALSAWAEIAHQFRVERLQPDDELEVIGRVRLHREHANNRLLQPGRSHSSRRSFPVLRRRTAASSCTVAGVQA